MPNDWELKQAREFPADNEFWQYSLRTYALPGVADLCLCWQEQDNINVNVLLWCTWLEQEGVQVTDALLGEVMAGAAPWGENLLHSIRNLRNKLKKQNFGPVGDSKALVSVREIVLKAELKAEQCLQSWLYTMAVEFLAEPESLHDSQTLAGANIALYFRATIGDVEDIDSRVRQWLSLCREQNPAKPT